MIGTSETVNEGEERTEKVGLINLLPVDMEPLCGVRRGSTVWQGYYSEPDGVEGTRIPLDTLDLTSTPFLLASCTIATAETLPALHDSPYPWHLQALSYLVTALA